MAYCTADDVMVWAEDDTLDATVLTILVEDAAEQIDRYCHRSFVAAGAQDANRLYDYNSRTPRRIHLREELTSLTSITSNSGGTWAATDVVLRPYQGPPYRIIELKDSSASFTYSGDTQQALTIAGKWGRPAVPSVIKTAAILVVISAYNRKAIQGFQNVGIGGLSVTPSDINSLPPEVLSRLKRLRRVRIEAL